MEEIIDENDDYKNIQIEYIDENRNPDIANSFDYYYVPSYFIDNEKLFEGIPTKKDIENVFQYALNYTNSSLHS